MARNKYELTAVGEGQAPRRGKRKCGPCPCWVYVLLLLVVLFLVAAALASYFVKAMLERNTIYPADTEKLYAGGEGIVEGDLVLDHNASEVRSAAADERLLWPLGRIPYRLDDQLGCPDSPRCDLLMEAMEEFNNRTCLRWEPARESDESAVSIQLRLDGGCRSSVGYRGEVGGEQVIVLGRGCFNKGFLLHEMGHTVGFLHEHTRADRDQWVKVQLNNTDDPDSFNMRDRSTQPITDTLDFESVMMYGPEAFSNGEGDGFTMVSHWPDTKPIPLLQNKTALSEQDVDRVRYIYNKQCRDRAQSENAGS